MKAAIILSYFCLSLLPSFGVCFHAQDTVLANHYLALAKAKSEAHEYDSTYHYADLASKLFLEADDSLNYGISIYEKGVGAHFQRNINEALANYTIALKIFDKFLDPEDVLFGDLYNSLGGVNIDLGHRFEARNYLEKALEIRNNTLGEDSISTAVTHYNLGLSCMYFGENRSSLQHFMKAMPVYLNKYGENGARVAQLYTNVGILHRYLGDYEHAKDYFNRAIEIHMENHGENYWNLAYPYANLGEVYALTAENDKALEYFLKTLKLCVDNPRQLIRLESIINAMLAKHYSEEGEYQKGMSHAHRAIEIIKTTYYEDHPRLNEYYRIIGDIYSKQGDFDTANQWFEKALDNVRNAYGLIHPQLAEVYRKQAAMYLEMQEYDKAEQTLQIAIQAISPNFEREVSDDLEPDIEEILDEKMYLYLITDLGQVFLTSAERTPHPQEKLLKALQYYSQAVGIIDHLRRGYISESSKLFLQENIAGIYEKAIASCDLLFSHTQDEKYLDKAFFFMEKSKASVLSEALQASDLNTIQGVPTSVLEKEKELNGYINSLELKLADLQAKENDSMRIALNKAIFRARISNDSLIQLIKSEYPNYHQLKYNMEVVSIDTIQQNLDKHSAVLSYFEGDSLWYVFSLSQQKMSLHHIDKSMLKNDDLIAFREAISNPFSSIQDFAPGAFMIYKNLIQMPLKEHTHINRIIVVPDGVLGYLPFDALITQTYAEVPYKPHYLIEDFTVSYASSMTLLYQSLQDTPLSDDMYAGFAPAYPEKLVADNLQGVYRDVLAQLSGTQEEVNFAGNIFSGRVFLEQEASESNFKHLDSSPSIIHLAMHALIDDQDPMQSRLLFAREDQGEEDGNLNAYEIYNLRLHSELAVLSACNTGYGKINRGEGILSLSRAFMYAGCPNILMSLWRAQDKSSTQIMSAFFENLKAEMPKDESLRQAKLKYFQQADPLKAHPANWATFVLLGNTEALTLPSNSHEWWIAIGALIFIAFCVLFYLSRKRKNFN